MRSSSSTYITALFGKVMAVVDEGGIEPFIIRVFKALHPSKLLAAILSILSLITISVTFPQPLKQSFPISLTVYVISSLTNEEGTVIVALLL